MLRFDISTFDNFKTKRDEEEFYSDWGGASSETAFTHSKDTVVCQINL